MDSYQSLPPETRVWIYQSNQPFSAERATEIRQHLANFATRWVSHNRQLRAFADLLQDRFIVLMVDESQAGASGCSIDASVKFLKGLQQAYGVELFDRLTFAYRDGEDIRLVSKDEFAQLYRDGTITDDTLVYDNLVKNKGEFEDQWVKPLKESWHARMV